MKSFFNLTDQVTYFDEKEKINKTFLAIAFESENFPLKSSLRKTKIRADEKYRPDKVSARLYNGNPLMSWVIDEVNNFYNGFSDYEQEKEIYYPSQSVLNSMGINFFLEEE